MSSFSPEALTAKLNSLNNTAQSIQTVSLWLIHHRKHAKIIVKVWFSHLMKGNAIACALTVGLGIQHLD